MSTKYTPGTTTLSAGGREIAMTDHARHRFRERTPHDRTPSLEACWRRGEWLEHPEVARSPDEERIDAARLYRHSDDWGVVFVVLRDTSPDFGTRSDADWVVATVINITGYDHGPSRAYLHGHEPHAPQGER